MKENAPKVRVIRRRGLKLSVGSLVLLLFCTFLIVTATFLQLNITSITFSGEAYSFKFIPQVPVVLFVAGFLGRKYGLAGVVLYILAGLFAAPVFALGGGWQYVFEYGFGYILAYVPAVFFAGSILRSGYSVRNLLHAAIVGVLTIHIIGVFYMLFLASIKGEGWTFMSGWISAQSGLKIVYDLIFSFFALFFARYVRILLWFYI